MFCSNSGLLLLIWTKSYKAQLELVPIRKSVRCCRKRRWLGAECTCTLRLCFHSLCTIYFHFESLNFVQTCGGLQTSHKLLAGTRDRTPFERDVCEKIASGVAYLNFIESSSGSLRRHVYWVHLALTKGWVNIPLMRGKAKLRKAAPEVLWDQPKLLLRLHVQQCAQASILALWYVYFWLCK